MANLPLAADNKTYLGFLVCERNFAWAFLTLRAHLSDSPRLTGRSNGAAGGQHRLVRNSPANFDCKHSINQCRTFRELSIGLEPVKNHGRLLGRFKR